MTVSQLESALADMPGDAEVRIAVGVFGGLAIQSIERLPEQPGTVWLANELDNDLTPEQAHAIMDRELGAEMPQWVAFYADGGSVILNAGNQQDAWKKAKSAKPVIVTEVRLK